MSEIPSFVPKEARAEEGGPVESFKPLESLTQEQANNLEVMQVVKEKYGDALETIVTDDGEEVLFVENVNSEHITGLNATTGIMFCKEGMIDLGESEHRRMGHIRVLLDEGESKNIAQGVISALSDAESWEGTKKNFGWGVAEYETPNLDQPVKIKARKVPYDERTNAKVGEFLSKIKEEKARQQQEKSKTVEEMTAGF